MKIALASPSIAISIDDGLDKVERCISTASEQGAEIVCFPEAYLPGLRGLDFEVPPFELADQKRVLDSVATMAHSHGIATILGTELSTDTGRQIAAVLFDEEGQIQGIQAKTQIDPSEDQFYVPGETRQLFEINGTKFGIAICHEGWRYPETVRWAATQGAKIVFHPQHTGSDLTGVVLTEFGSTSAPYYEKAMMCRGLENTIYFASVNYGMRFQESATCVITPAGECQAQLPYGKAGVLVQEINIDAATGLLASRYAPERYPQ